LCNFGFPLFLSFGFLSLNFNDADLVVKVDFNGVFDIIAAMQLIVESVE